MLTCHVVFDHGLFFLGNQIVLEQNGDCTELTRLRRQRRRRCLSKSRIVLLILCRKKSK
jgi:hypothetical protein